MSKIGIIGGGNMGEAILKGIRRKYSVCVCEASASRQRYLRREYKVKIVDLKKLLDSCRVIILAIKPQTIDTVLSAMRDNLTKRTLVISIVAGITSIYIEKRLGPNARVIRTMPNMPAQVGYGITALSKGKSATKADLAKASHIFDQVGETIVAKENSIDAITAVSGSGPAYVFNFAENMTNAAKSLGLTEAQSKKLVEATLYGTSYQLLNQDEDAATLREKVTSKGGTTEAALKVFRKNKISKIFKDALKAAKKRAKELSKK